MVTLYHITAEVFYNFQESKPTLAVKGITSATSKISRLTQPRTTKIIKSPSACKDSSINSSSFLACKQSNQPNQLLTQAFEMKTELSLKETQPPAKLSSPAQLNPSNVSSDNSQNKSAKLVASTPIIYSNNKINSSNQNPTVVGIVSPMMNHKSMKSQPGICNGFFLVFCPSLIYIFPILSNFSK